MEGGGGGGGGEGEGGVVAQAQHWKEQDQQLVTQRHPCYQIAVHVGTIAKITRVLTLVVPSQLGKTDSFGSGHKVRHDL